MNNIKYTKNDIIIGRILRNTKEAIKYPLWIARGAPPPDNHHFKARRIKKIGHQYDCRTLIETGTFFGQTVAAARHQFQKVISVELSDALYEGNRRVFEKYAGIKIFHGDSSNLLAEMIDQASGRILFWLDGHFSAGVTACGKETTPILDELDAIRQKMRSEDCILIDDIRLFSGKEGYPMLDAVKEMILNINPKYKITIDHDCLIALPARQAVNLDPASSNFTSDSTALR